MTTVDLERFMDAIGAPMPRAAPAPAPLSGWTLVAGANNVGPQYVLANARQKQLQFRVDDSASLQFVMDGLDTALSYITELVTDIWVYKNGALVDRFRVGSAVDTIDGEADTYEVQITCFDYREWLGRQFLQPGFSWSYRNVTQASILNDLITKVINGQSGIHPTITVDSSKMTGGNVNFDSTVGTSVKEVVGVMAGFGWQVVPNGTLPIVLRAISPWYYHLNPNFALQYGGTVKKVTRTFDTGAYANSSIYTGDMKLAPIQSDASGISTMPQGRMGETKSDPSILDVTHLQHAASLEATNAQNVVPSWACELAPNIWNSPTDAWLGDICRFVVNKGRLVVNDQYRITEIQVQINDDAVTNNADIVSMTLVKPPYVPSS